MIGGNWILVFYGYNCNGGVMVNLFFILIDVIVDKVLVIGGDLLVRFVNDVVLIFNGFNGFIVDVGLELFFDLL